MKDCWLKFSLALLSLSSKKGANDIVEKSVEHTSFTAFQWLASFQAYYKEKFLYIFCKASFLQQTGWFENFYNKLYMCIAITSMCAVC
jgi:hypothetical protein